MGCRQTPRCDTQIYDPPMRGAWARFFSVGLRWRRVDERHIRENCHTRVENADLHALLCNCEGDLWLSEAEFNRLGTFTYHHKTAHGTIHELALRANCYMEVVQVDKKVRYYTCTRVWGRILELFNSLISFVCLITIIVFGLEKNAFPREVDYHNPPPGHIQLWENNMILSKDQAYIDAVGNYTEAFDGYCPSKPAHMLQVTWYDKNSTGMIIAAEYGETVNLWLCLFFVFFISFIFQMWRYRQYGKHVKGYHPERGPDFGRWCEYACTSPLQIVVVCAAFGIGNKSLLMSLAAMQAALVMTGYSIEKQMDKFLKIKTKSRHCMEKIIYAIENGQKYQRESDNFHVPCVPGKKLLFLQCLAAVLHIFIWWIIGTHFARYLKWNDKCNSADPTFKPPDEALLIFWSQLILFTTYAFINYSGCFKVKYVRDTISLNCAGNMELAINHISSERARFWENISFRYSLNSITVKTFLDVAFLLYVNMDPRSV